MLLICPRGKSQSSRSARRPCEASFVVGFSLKGLKGISELVKKSSRGAQEEGARSTTPRQIE